MSKMPKNAWNYKNVKYLLIRKWKFSTDPKIFWFTNVEISFYRNNISLLQDKKALTPFLFKRSWQLIHILLEFAHQKAISPFWFIFLFNLSTPRSIFIAWKRLGLAATGIFKGKTSYSISVELQLFLFWHFLKIRGVMAFLFFSEDLIQQSYKISSQKLLSLKVIQEKREGAQPK